MVISDMNSMYHSKNKRVQSVYSASSNIHMKILTSHKWFIEKTKKLREKSVGNNMESHKSSWIREQAKVQEIL